MIRVGRRSRDAAFRGSIRRSFVRRPCVVRPRGADCASARGNGRAVPSSDDRRLRQLIEGT